MSLSSQQIALHLPALRENIQQWRETQKKSTPAQGSTVVDLESKSVVIAFRTRPILPGEGLKFVPVEEQESATDENQYVCEAITFNETSVVAHSPSMKVCS